MAKKNKEEAGFIDLGELEMQPVSCPIDEDAGATLEQFDIGIYKLYDDVKLPKYGTGGAACFDLHAHLVEGLDLAGYSANNDPISIRVRKDNTGLYVTLLPGFRALIPTGLIFDLPVGTVMFAYPRSGLSFKQGLNLFNNVGVIDCDYVDPMFITAVNTSSAQVRINQGDRVCQARIEATRQFSFGEVSAPPTQKTDRNGGFGSTGK